MISYILNVIDRSLTCFQVNSSNSEEILWMYHFEGGWNGLNLGTNCLPLCIAELISLRRLKDAVNSLSGLSGKTQESPIVAQPTMMFFFKEIIWYWKNNYFTQTLQFTFCKSYFWYLWYWSKNYQQYGLCCQLEFLTQNER